jgi:hypothetical protein
MNQRKEPPRTAKNASNVTTIEALPGTKTTHENLRSICNDLIFKDLYSLLDANNYMEEMSKWQRQGFRIPFIFVLLPQLQQ